MAGYIPTRLIPILGAPVLEDLQEVHLDRLLGVVETADLEFKEQTYDKSGEKTKELAYDIAAMANDVGGLLIIGIADVDGRATSLEGVDLNPFGEEEELRIHKIVASRLFPAPRIEVHRVDSTKRQGKVFYVISIPPSEWAPHAVAADFPSFRWPRRDGPGRRWMSETEIADAYRRRHGAEEDQVDQAHEIHRAMAEVLPHTEEGWLQLTLVPNRIGHMKLSRASVQEYENWLNRADDGAFPGFGRSSSKRYAQTAYRSIRFTDGYRAEDPAYWQYGWMYTDGSVTLAARYSVEEGEDFLEIHEEKLLGDVVNGLLILGQHAVERTFTGGDAVLISQFWAALGLPMLLTGMGRDRIPEQLGGSIRLTTASERSQHTVSLEDISTPGAGLVSVARMVLCDLMSGFAVPEPRQLTEEAAIKLHTISDGQKPAVKGWAENYGAPLEP
jgi:hypothetical protein